MSSDRMNAESINSLLITLPGITFWNSATLTLHLSQINTLHIPTKTHSYSAWSSFHYEDGHINVGTEGTAISQGPRTVRNYCNDNSEVYII